MKTTRRSFFGMIAGALATVFGGRVELSPWQRRAAKQPTTRQVLVRGRRMTFQETYPSPDYADAMAMTFGRPRARDALEDIAALPELILRAKRLERGQRKVLRVPRGQSRSTWN